MSSDPTIKSKRLKAKLVLSFVLAIGVFAYGLHLAIAYGKFSKNLTQINGIRIGDSRAEVKYRMGIPPEVLGAVVDDKEYKGYQLVYSVNAPTNDVNRMPPNTKVEDYDSWVYEKANGGARMTVEFNKMGAVASIDLYSESNEAYTWESIGGIHCGDPEEKVLRLGKPSNQHLEGVTKTIEYSDIGITVTLTKGRAYLVRIKGPQSKTAVLSSFLRSYF